jgi:hypothetical protein
MTGEKDPRNLMLVFSILKVVMMEWDISDYAEVYLFIPLTLRAIADGDSYFLTLCTTTFRLLSDPHRTIHTGLQLRT